MATKVNITVKLRSLLFKAWQSIVIAGLLCTAYSLPAAASYIPFNTNVNMNIGIGTSTPQAGLVVPFGNVGIGTWTAAGGNLIVNGNGNVGIGSAWPGQKLDVNGTVRMTNLTMSGQTPISGYVLTASDSAGDTTWTSPGAVSGWTISGNNVYETLSGNVGIGTTTVNQGALTVMNGNVGIGTFAPIAQLQISGGPVTSGNSLVYAVSYENNTSGQAADILAGQFIQAPSNSSENYITMGIYPTVNSNVNYTNTVIGSQENFTDNGTGIISAAYGTQGNITNASTGTISFGAGGDFAVFNESTGAVTEAIGVEVAAVQGKTVGYGAYVTGVSGAASNYDFYANDSSAKNYFAGNVGIGSLAPGQALDINGTIRTMAFTMSGQTPTSGYVLTASDSAGDSTWTSIAAIGGWTVSGNNVYEFSNGNVGIGTTLLTTSALTVMNGNVGIGTWIPAYSLDILGTARMTGFILNNAPVAGDILMTNSIGLGTWIPASGVATPTPPGGTGTELQYRNGANFAAVINSAVNPSGNVGLGTTLSANKFEVNGSVGIGTAYAGYITGPANGLIVQGNVGIGSARPGQALDVNGTVRMTNLTMSGQTPISGYVLTASDSAGDTTWTSPGAVSGWTISGNNVYETLSGNVGIGTTTVNQGAFVVTNGNVGIGTWAPAMVLDVQGTARLAQGIEQGLAVASGTNTTALGNVTSGGTISSSGTGSLAGGWSHIGTIQATINGSFAWGNEDSGTITSSGNGSVAMGRANGGTLQATGTGSVALGAETAGTLQATGFASIAIGDGVQANANDASAFGLNVVNPNADSFMVGFNPTPTLTVTGTGVGIGTSSPFGGELIVTGGNVGIGSLTPGQALDVQGTIRTTAFTMGGQTPISGYVLTASDSAGDTTWTSPGSVSGWTISGNNVYETLGGNVGIGTTTVNQGSLVVTNGNVGIGTWAPTSLLQINQPNGSPFVVNSSGKVGIGTITPQTALAVTSGNVGIGTWTASGSLIVATGNVGIGSLTPGQALDVTGTVRTVAFTMSGQTPTSGYVLTASDSAGDATWASASAVGGWTVSGNNVYETLSGNVGIGTTTVNQGSLVVTNGNVGIGTWAPAGLLQVNATTNSPLTVTSNGNVGIGTTTPQGAFEVTSGSVGIGTWTDESNGAFSLSVVGHQNIWMDNYGSDGVLDVGRHVANSTSAFVTISPDNGAAGSQLTRILEVSGARLSPSSEILTIKNSVNGNTLFDFMQSGKFGIATASPSSAVTVNGGVGIGTSLTNNAYINSNSAPLGGLIVQGNVGIGTFNPFGGGLIVLPASTGNIGIGSLTPGQALDVAGTVRTTAFTMSGQTPISGYVLTASDSTGDTTWTSPSSVSGWTISGNNVYETAGGNVGIGTTLLTTSALTVMNGNVGLGTWIPAYSLDVFGTARMTGFILNNAPVAGDILMTNSIGLGTWIPASGVATPTPPGGTGTELQYRNGTSFAAVINSAVNPSGNVGLGTTLSANKFDVNGSVGIGTAYAGYITGPVNGLIVQGNVGLGSTAPGQALDIQGTARMTGFTLTGNGVASGNVLVTNGVGVGTWMSPTTLLTSSQWVNSNANDVYLPNNGNVGLGTSITTAGAALSIMNGNVGIGTWVPGGALVVTNGNVGIGKNPTSQLHVYSITNDTALTLEQNTGTNGADSRIIFQHTSIGKSSEIWGAQPGGSVTDISFKTNNGSGLGTAMYIAGSGNVGIGSLTPGQTLDVQGTVRTMAFTMSGQTPISGYVLTASDSAGDTTWTSPGAVSGWTISGNNVYETAGGNVGIGTTTVNQGSLVVTNGNVGIGTWAPHSALEIEGGNVGIGSTTPTQTLSVGGSGFLSGNLNFEGGLGLGVVNNGVGFNSTSGTIIANASGATPQWLNLEQNGTSGILVLSRSSNNNDQIISGNGDLVLLTNTSSDRLHIAQGGNIGIGTFNPFGGGLIVTNGNVGIGSLVPGQILDVQGTVRTTAFTMSGQTPISGYVLTASDSAGDTTWTSPGSVSGWTIAGNNVYETAGGNVGIGTTTVNQGALVVTNGNVGIGTWTTAGGSLIIQKGNVGIGSAWPGVSLDVQGTVRALFFVGNGSQLTNLPAGGAAGITNEVQYNSTGNLTGSPNFVFNNNNVGIGTITPVAQLAVAGSGVGIGTNLNDNYLTTTPPLGGMIVEGNIGIGSLTPGQKLDVNGTVRTTAFTMSGQTPISGYVLTASDSAGDTTWTSPGSVSGWTISGNNVYETASGNVGIGTTTVNQGSLVVTNGNVGIGTWTTSPALITVFVPAQTAASTYLAQQWTINTNNTSNVAVDGYGGFMVGSHGSSPGYFEKGPYLGQVSNGGGGGAGGAGGVAITYNLRSANLGGIGQYYDTTDFASAFVQQKGNFNFYTAASGATGTSASTSTVLTILNGGNVGIGTINPVAALAVVGNIGIGTGANSSYVTTTPPSGGMIVQGNVGIGSLTPGQALDVTGTVRTTAFTMSGQTPISGYVLTASDSAGDTTWTSPGSVSGWTISGNNVYETNSGNVGIGTTTVNQGALVVTNGNVGIGTWVPASLLQINQPTGSPFVVNSSGKVGIGTITPQTALAVTSGNVGIGTWTAAGGSLIVATGNVGISSLTPGQALDVQGTSRMTGFTLTGNGASNGFVMVGNSVGIGTWMSAITLGINSQWSGTTGSNIYYSFPGANVGIGSSNPGQILDVTGTVRTTGFAMSGQTPISGYVLTASDSAGDTTWTSPGAVSGWTISGNNVYETLGGNVGIGTTLLTTSALTVMNGNVGIGTWKPVSSLDIVGKVSFENTTGSASQATLLQTGGHMSLSAGSNGLDFFSGNGNDTMFINNTGVGIGAPYVTGSASIVPPANGLIVSGNVGIGTFSPFGGGLVVLPANTGNVGIGSLTPGQALDVTGTVRTTAFAMSGQTPISGYVLTASDSAGDTTWTSPGSVSGWTISGNNVYETLGGNVGIGTTLLTTSALTVMNGNVGIGTWKPGNSLEIVGGNIGIGTAYSLIGIGTTSTILTMQTDTSSIYVGWNAGASLTKGLNGNTALGSQALNANTTGNSNVAVGNDSLMNNTTANNNTAVGLKALKANITGGNNTAVGQAALNNIGSGGGTYADNTALGFTAGNAYLGGSSLTQATQSTFLGDSTEALANNDTNETVIGYGAIGNGSNTVTIGNTSVVSTILEGNIGIGTWLPVNQLAVNGAVGIGTVNSTFVTTVAPTGGMIVQGNVGIGSLTPGQKLDVTGTVRTTFFAMSGQTPANGYVMTSIDSAGDATWTSIANVSGWTVSGNNVYEADTGNVGIGTTTVNQGSLVVTNGNVGIGTWAPAALLDVKGGIRGVSEVITGSSQFTASGTNFDLLGGGTTNTYLVSSPANGSNVTISFPDNTGTLAETDYAQAWTALQTFSANVGIGTIIANNQLTINGGVGIGTANSNYVTTVAPSGGMIVQGNVGIGSLTPGQALDVAGTVRTTAFTMSGQTPISGYVLTASDSAGDTTWTSPGSVSGWTITGNNVYETNSGNVGIGTTTVNQGAFVVANGNVGLGTWSPNAQLAVSGSMSLTPSSTTNITAAGGITVSKTIMRIQGNGGAVTVTANPQITSGVDGQIVVLEGMSASNTVTLSNGTGLKLANGVGFTLALGKTMTLVYDAVNGLWVEISRADN